MKRNMLQMISANRRQEKANMQGLEEVEEVMPFDDATWRVAYADLENMDGWSTMEAKWVLLVEEYSDAMEAWGNGVFWKRRHLVGSRV